MEGSSAVFYVSALGQVDSVSIESRARESHGTMSDNQSWNSSGSEEDIEPREEPGHHVGVADLSGVLSKVSSFLSTLKPLRGPECDNLLVGSRHVACPPPDRGVFRVFHILYVCARS